MTGETATVRRMRAISQDTLGGPEVLKTVEVDRPEPGPAEILVRVHAAGVNPTDYKTRESGVFMPAPPFTLGREVSGVVEAVGWGVTLFAPGDEVFGMPNFPRPSGGYAEYVTGPTRHFAAKPATLDHVRAAALPLASLTAWQALVETADLRPGHRVVIHAAAGGVGHLAVQIAKQRGAYVIGTARAANHGFLRELGADEVVDYAREDPAAARGIDVVLDAHGDYAAGSLDSLRPGGIVIDITRPYDVSLAAAAREQGRRGTSLLVEADHAGMEAVAAMAADGRLRPEIAAVLPLEEVAKAHTLSREGRTRGKIVLTVADRGAPPASG